MANANIVPAHIQTIDLALRTIAKRRCGLDVEEARWLREAARAEIWRAFAEPSLLQYLERAMGYTPRMAIERLRVARALEDLPAMTQALAGGALPYSAVRELTRIATPATEAEWCDASRTKTVGQIQTAVANRKHGDRPSDPETPNLENRVIRLEVTPETYARFRAAEAALAEAHGGRLEEDRFVAALCGLALDAPAGGAHADAGRSRHEIATTVCERCNQGWQTAAGMKVAISAAAVDRVQCDATHIGSLDAEEPARAVQSIPPATRRLVWRRDGGKCTVPGCRSTVYVDIHHIVPKSRGGAHATSNLTCLCDAHHVALHEGRLPMSGTAPHALVFGESEVGAHRPSAASRREDAKSALVNMGWPPRVAGTAVDQAITQLGTGSAAGITVVIRAALRCCPT